MPARVVELGIVDVEGLAYYRFRWEGEGPEWFAALEEIKRRVPAEWRSFDAQSKLWMVEAAFHAELVAIFGRQFESAVDAIRSQLSLFGGAA